MMGQRRIVPPTGSEGGWVNVLETKVAALEDRIAELELAKHDMIAVIGQLILDVKQLKADAARSQFVA